MRCMTSPSSEFALLLSGADAVTIDLARELLESSGIPSVAHGPDFDFVELGRAAHDGVRHQDLYVPHSALDRAKAVLTEAWGKLQDSKAAERTLDADKGDPNSPANFFHFLL